MGQEPLSNRDEGAATTTIGAGTTGYDDDLMESAAPATDGGGRGANNTSTGTAREAAPVYGYPVAYAAPVANYAMPTVAHQTAANRFRVAGTPNQMYHGFIATAFCGCLGMLCSMCGCWTLYGRSGAMFGCAVWLTISTLFSASQLYVLLATACDRDDEDKGSSDCMSQGWFLYNKMRLIIVMTLSCVMIGVNIYMGKKSKRRADSETEQAYMEQQSAQAFVIPTSPLVPRPR